LVIEATRTDPRFATHAATAAFPNIGSYLGAPIFLSDGAFFGTLCAVDAEPRPFSREQVNLMVMLARLVATELERDRELVERNRVESALRASERRFRSLVQNAFDVITIISAAGTISYESPSIERILGYTPEDLIGSDAFTFVHPDDAAEVRDRFLASLDVPGSHELVTFRFRHKDGSWRWLEGIGTNLLDDPNVRGIVFNSRDVTERKRLAEEAARADAFAHSDRLKSALLATVSHELRTPLATIKTGVSSLLSPEARWTTTEQEEFLREIDMEVDRLTLMVSNLLDLSRIEGGALRPRLARHDLGELVADVVRRLSYRTPDHPLAMEVDPSLPPVPCDAVQIGQVLLNLGDNAIKYTPPGTPVTFSVRRVTDAVEVQVADRGPGIPASEIDQIFEKFYRVSAHAMSSGAGLGLAICMGLVKAHGGHIWAESREGEGTAVRFTLPLFPGHEELCEP
jgi:PAS domain S-box-containing protein